MVNRQPSLVPRFVIGLVALGTLSALCGGDFLLIALYGGAVAAIFGLRTVCGVLIAAAAGMFVAGGIGLYVGMLIGTVLGLMWQWTRDTPQPREA